MRAPEDTREQMLAIQHLPYRKFENGKYKFGCFPRIFDQVRVTPHADHVGAINVSERGLRLFARGGKAQAGRPSKQKPTEAIDAVPAWMQ
jgi:hypothetical protein